MFGFPFHRLMPKLSRSESIARFRPSRIADRAARGVFTEPADIEKNVTVKVDYNLKGEAFEIKESSPGRMFLSRTKSDAFSLFGDMLFLNTNEIDELIDLLTLAKNAPKSEERTETLVV